MRRYLATLHQKPDEHKKRFALLASSTITLFIFGIWSLTTFGVSEDSTLAKSGKTEVESAVTDDDVVSPFESFQTSLGSSFEALKDTFGRLKSGVEEVNLEVEYQQMRDKALDTYGE